MTKLLISLSVGHSKDVLAKIALTISHASPGRSRSGTGTYSRDSCYGKIAWYLREHKSWNPSDTILLFGVSKDMQDVAHACLYSDQGKVIVDTFKGKPVNVDGSIVYRTNSGSDYALIAAVTLDRFRKEYLNGK